MYMKKGMIVVLLFFAVMFLLLPAYPQAQAETGRDEDPAGGERVSTVLPDDYFIEPKTSFR